MIERPPCVCAFRSAMSASAVVVAILTSLPQAPNETQMVTPLFDMCSAPGESCVDTGCCARPGFACMKEKANPENKECRRTTGVCEDTDNWACPSKDFCQPQFGDCRTSLCCQNVPYFRGNQNVQFQCVRRPAVYYAQCRPPSNLKTNECVDSDDWLCPGWERCAAAYAECTHSRCCADPEFSCYLNATALSAGGGWHAWCRPTEHVEGPDGAGCDAGGPWVCPHQWMAHVHEKFDGAVALAEWYVEKEPAEVAAFGLIVLIVGISTAMFCVVLHRRQMAAQMRRLERELEMAREKRREEAIKGSGEGEGAALRDTVALEERGGGPPSPLAQRGMVPELAAIAPALDTAVAAASVATVPPPSEVVNAVEVQATWQACAPPDSITIATPPSAPRGLALKGASTAAAAVGDVEEGDGTHGANASRAMAALRNKRG